MRNFPGILVALLCSLFAADACADIADQINVIRNVGCKGHAGVNSRLQASTQLSKVAREWSRGGRLHEAISRTGYRSLNSASMRVQGAANDGEIIRTLAQNYCDSITDAQFTQIGVFRNRDQIWIVLAAPFTVPAIRDAGAIGNQVLKLVNEARAKARRCGSKAFDAAPSLTLSAMLNRAALTHAQDMASRNFFEHEGSDGSTPAQRISKAGYEWRAVAENIAAGATSAEQVVDGWLKSPGHCANIMGSAYTQMGIAYAVDARSDAEIYWAQDFARPR